jgi:hypothetical protein
MGAEIMTIPLTPLHSARRTRTAAPVACPTPAQNPQQLAVDIPTLLCQYRAMLGETQNQFSFTCVALSKYGCAKGKFLPVVSLQMGFVAQGNAV